MNTDTPRKDHVGRLDQEVGALRKDKERLDWLCQCTAGEWEELQNIRLSKPVGYLRQAIDDAIEKEKV